MVPRPLDGMGSYSVFSAHEIPSNNELEGLCWEEVAAYFKHLPAGTEETHGRLHAVPESFHSKCSHKMAG
jgi:hypothetical protein